MNELSATEILNRKKYTANHAPALLGQILNGAMSSGKAVEPSLAAGLAILCAEALYDQLKHTSE